MTPIQAEWLLTPLEFKLDRENRKLLEENAKLEREKAAALGIIEGQRGIITELEAKNRCLREGLFETMRELVWCDYNEGLEKDGLWWHGGMSAAESIADDLDLAPGWHAAAYVRSKLDEVTQFRMDVLIGEQHLKSSDIPPEGT